MRHMLGNLSPNYFERTKRYMMLRASRQGTDLTVSGTPPLSLPNSLGKPLKAWSVDLLPYQEGTGDPAPDNVRPIHGTDKLNLFVEESYDQSATPKAVLTLPQTVYGGELRMNEDGSGLLVLDRVYEEFTFDNPDTNSGYDSKIFTLSNISTGGTSANGKITNVVNEYAYTGTSYGAPHFYIVNNVCVIYLPENTYRGGAIQVCYPLATPITYPITSPPIPTPSGTATTWATAEDGTVDGMEVTYVGKA